MSQLPVTIVGNLAADPLLRKLPGGSLKGSLRVASSRRWAKTDAEGNVEWNETDLLFIDVEAWGDLAAHMRQSLKKGMPVIVVGSLNISQYEDKEGKKCSRTVLRATSVGLDLNRYIIASRRMDRNNIPEGMELPADNEVAIDEDFTGAENGEAPHGGDQGAGGGAGAAEAAGKADDTATDTAADSQAARADSQAARAETRAARKKQPVAAGQGAPPF
ncbi:single-stranded DNA-binding protein [Corynebacterium phocae]|uniref:single-stranded DNA-binding protein n=1 Tax=Corynebacterium phocae TaxID=161895 RepID=UPI000952F54E|nr:single-stranded DNA-binding protein [Corynebacterium phocae]KAA8726426.1 single-stranded DNA-binding protein [Corynebacterium phocae]